MLIRVEEMNFVTLLNTLLILQTVLYALFCFVCLLPPVLIRGFTPEFRLKFAALGVFEWRGLGRIAAKNVPRAFS